MMFNVPLNIPLRFRPASGATGHSDKRSCLIAEGTPDLSGRHFILQARCRINAAFPSLWPVVSAGIGATVLAGVAAIIRRSILRGPGCGWQWRQAGRSADGGNAFDVFRVVPA